MTARSLLALRAMVAAFRTSAIRRANAVEQGAVWSYTYRPADDPESLKDICEAEFDAEPGSGIGHPRPGEYAAVAKDPASGDVLFDYNGEWLPDMGGITKDESPEGLGGYVLAVTKAATSTLANAEQAEAKAMRRASQAEAREEAKDKKLQETVAAMEGLRDELRIAQIAKQGAEQRQLEAEAQRDAAIADKDELIKTGGELAQPINAFVMRAYRIACEHMGEDPVAFEAEFAEKATNESLSQIGVFLLNTRVTLPVCDEYPADIDGNPRSAILALLLHYHYGLPWLPLRILFHESFGVWLESPPPIDWSPPVPGEAPGETIDTATGEIHPGSDGDVS